jgi:hypothetical protein
VVPAPYLFLGLESPCLSSLTFTHILQIDSVKELGKTMYIVEVGRASALSSRFPWTFPKMWVKVSPFKAGSLRINVTSSQEEYDWLHEVHQQRR